MGLIVVYRYRPMRLVPTITTRLIIARLSLLRCSGHYVCWHGASTGKGIKFRLFWDILLRTAGALAIFVEKWGVNFDRKHPKPSSLGPI